MLQAYDISYRDDLLPYTGSELLFHPERQGSFPKTGFFRIQNKNYLKINSLSIFMLMHLRAEERMFYSNRLVYERVFCLAENSHIFPIYVTFRALNTSPYPAPFRIKHSFRGP